VLGGYQKHEQTPRGYQGGFTISLYPFFHENRWFFEVLETPGNWWQFFDSDFLKKSIKTRTDGQFSNSET